MNCGATVPRVSFENLREDRTMDLYCSRTGSTEVLIKSDAACNHIAIINSMTESAEMYLKQP